MSDYPHAPARGTTDTQAEAASALAPVHGRLQRMVLFAVREVGGAGLTAEELAGRLNLPREAVQPRTSELRRLGLLHDSG